MELRAYWRIFQRRWWIALLIVAATALISFLTSPLSQGSYSASLRLLLGVRGEPPQGQYFRYNGYYGLLSTEYLTDDFIEVVRSQSFRERVIQAMQPAPQNPVGVTAQPRSERAPRIITISITAANEEDARRAGEAAAQVATQRIGEYFPQLGAGAATATVIDPPSIAPPGAAGRNYVNILLRSLAGLAAGVGLVYLLHYLDNRLYTADEVEHELGIPVLARLRSERS